MWLNTPVEKEPPKSGKPPPPETRLQKLRRERKDTTYEPALPEIFGGADLLEWFWDVGPAAAGAPLTHAEIRSWQDNTGFELQSWQARLLRRMSQEYLGEIERAADEKCQPPCPLADFAPAPAAVAEALRLRMRQMAEN